MKIVSIIGARPQFIKAAPVSKALRQMGLQELIIHTGQHYDSNMSEVFFDELCIPQPDFNLGIGSGSHGRQTGEMLAAIEDQLLLEKPDWVLVYGDTNSTLAGSLAAAKLHIPIVHVEAGLRSFNRKMPEEVNRVLSDQLSTILCCPSQRAVDNLAAENITSGVYLVGDVMFDAVVEFSKLAENRSLILNKLELAPRSYLLATIHRAENTDDRSRLGEILSAFSQTPGRIIFPIHPRTRKMLEKYQLLSSIPDNLQLIEPLGYLDMLRLQQNASLILTDSGGVQKEAYWLGVPCLTLRDETEWAETLETGWNTLVGAKNNLILDAFRTKIDMDLTSERPMLYGDGHSAHHIAKTLKTYA